MLAAPTPRCVGYLAAVGVQDNRYEPQRFPLFR